MSHMCKTGLRVISPVVQDCNNNSERKAFEISVQCNRPFMALCFAFRYNIETEYGTMCFLRTVFTYYFLHSFKTIEQRHTRRTQMLPAQLL